MASDKPSQAARGVSQAWRALKAARRKPTDDDRPPPRPFPGQRPSFIKGQLTFEDAEGDDAA
jgi:hypothetical protein